jgi:cytochrome c biogenesis protein CcdA
MAALRFSEPADDSKYQKPEARAPNQAWPEATHRASDRHWVILPKHALAEMLMYSPRIPLPKGAQLVVTVLLLALSVTTAAAGTSLHAEGVVRFFYFYDPDCSVCEELHRDFLEPLLASYGNQVVVDERNIEQTADFELLLRLEQEFQVASVSIPEVFIGKDALIGPEQIQDQLKERIEHYLAQGGVDLPTATASAAPRETPTRPCTECDEIHQAEQTAAASRDTPAPARTPTASAGTAEKPPIYAAYFYQTGCGECDRAESDVKHIEEKYPQLKVQHFDVKDDAALNEYLSLRAGVPSEKHLTAPALFIGDGYLVGDEIRASAIEALIQPYLASGAAEPWAGWEASQEATEQTIVERFRSLGLWTVIGAGLLDGINPCAFATMIFLVSYLSVRKRQGRELLATGAAFTTGVFLAYFGVGFGLLKFLTALPVLSVISRWIYGLTLVLCLALAWGSFADYRKAREGRLDDMSLKLPNRLRTWVRHLIREGSRARNFVLASLVLGFAVSIVELACTGQVYLPTIVFVLGVPEWRARATLALLAYNIMFVLPLIGIFLLVYYGTTSKQLTSWMTKHAATVKLGTAVLFLLMAGWLGYSLFA